MAENGTSITFGEFKAWLEGYMACCLSVGHTPREEDWETMKAQLARVEVPEPVTGWWGIYPPWSPGVEPFVYPAPITTPVVPWTVISRDQATTTTDLMSHSDSVDGKPEGAA